MLTNAVPKMHTKRKAAAKRRLDVPTPGRSHHVYGNPFGKEQFLITNVAIEDRQQMVGTNFDCTLLYSCKMLDPY